MKPIPRLFVILFAAFLGWAPNASHATYAAQCAGCHGDLSLLSNNFDRNGSLTPVARAIRAANNPNYLTALISRPPPTMGGLVLANVNVNAIASEIAANPNVRAPVITSSAPPGSGTRGVTYSHTYTATGTPVLAGNPGLPNAFAVTAGALPTGLTLNGTTGVISGTPTVAGSFTGTVTASNFIAPAAQQNFSITISNPPVAPAITSSAPPNGTRGVAYSHTYTATGNPAPTFAVTAGALPTGLALNGTTGAVSGTPTAAGLFTGTVTASNGVNPTAAQNFSITINISTAVDLNQHGLTGSWYEPATSGQGFEVEVFPDQSAPGTGSVFVSWFTYDVVVGGADRQRWYTLFGPVASGQPTASLTIYQNTGGNFNALPTTMSQPVGTATLSFATCTSGQLAYNFTDGTGRAGSIPLTRLTPNVTCSTTSPHPTNSDFALSGNWYAPATSGQGFTVDFNPNSGLFSAWYTYAPSGAGAGAAGQRWYTAQAGIFAPGSRSIPVQIYQTTGGMFDAPTVNPPTTTPVGSGTLAFQNCSSATFSYNFTGGSSSGMSGTITLKRVGPVPPGCTQ